MSSNVNKSTPASTVSKKVGRVSKFRKMKAYKPRAKRRTTKTQPGQGVEQALQNEYLSLQKQQLADLEHRLSSDVGSFLVLLKQGTPEQISHASQKSRSDFMKIGPEMQKIALELSGNLPEYVARFLRSIDNVLHTASGWIDDAQINECYQATQQLEDALKIKHPRAHS